MSRGDRSDGDLLFVYGTLRRGSRCGAVAHEAAPVGRAAFFSEDFATFISEATFQGMLYLVDWYPAAVPSDDAQDCVRGELYRLRDSGAWDALDEYEGCAESSPRPVEYRRKSASVTRPDGRTSIAWIYLYNGDTEQLEIIPSGDFLDAEPDKRRGQSDSVSQDAAFL